MTESKQAAIERLARSPLAVTRELIVGMHPDEPSAQYAPVHYEIERRYLDYRTTFINYVAPRGIAKSTVVAGGCPLHHLFLEDVFRFLELGPAEQKAVGRPVRTRKHVVLISKSQREAKKRLTTIKNILGNAETGEHSARFRELFGDWSSATARKWTEEQVILKDGSVITAIGTGQTVRGLNEGGLRPTLIIVDDPEDENNTKTPEALVENKRWLFQAVRPALDRRRGRLVVIGTPITTTSMVVSLHQSFVGGRSAFDGAPLVGTADSVWFQQMPETDNALGQMGENRTSMRPGEHVFVDELRGERLEKDDDGTQWVVRPGLLWPEWITPVSLADEKRLCEETEGVGLGVYYREHCCLIVGNEEQVFKPEYFLQTWRGHLEVDPLGGVEHTLVVTHRRGVPVEPPERLRVCVSTGVDPAFSTSSTADRTAKANVATTFDDDIYELAGLHQRLHPSVLLSGIAADHALKPPARGLMEVTAAQEFVWMQLAKDHGIRYLKDRPRTSKKGEGSRIASLEPFMKPKEDGRPAKFYHLEGSPLKSELVNYPRGKDDFADATEKAVRCRMRPSEREARAEDAVDEWPDADELTDPLVL